MSKTLMMSLCACGSVLGLAAGFADAGNTLYSQASDRVDQPSFFSDAVAGQFFSQRMADNFTLSGDSSISGIRWWGGSQNFQFADVVNVISWSVKLYSDNGFGTVSLASEIDLGNFSFAETNAVATGASLLAGGIEYQQEISFDAIDLAAGDYWVSIGATLESPGGDAWVWSGSTRGDLVNATNFFDGGGFITFDPTFNDLAFEVIGVPAPGAMVPLLGAFAFARRRRSA